MKKSALVFVTSCSLLLAAAASNAGLIFTFSEEVGGVRMTSSGEIDVSGLVMDADIDDWGGRGIEENGNHDIMGNTTGGDLDTTYGFNAGTDFSQWASAAGPWADSHFSWVAAGGDNRSFTTYRRVTGDNTQLPGLGIIRSDLVGDIWSTDQSWFTAGESFASLQMFAGDYTVSDAVSGEFITFRIGGEPPVSVPVPAPLALLGLGLLGLRLRRKA